MRDDSVTGVKPSREVSETATALVGGSSFSASGSSLVLTSSQSVGAQRFSGEFTQADTPALMPKTRPLDRAPSRFGRAPFWVFGLSPWSY